MKDVVSQLVRMRYNNRTAKTTAVREGEYAAYLQSFHWKSLRLKVLEASGGQCERCGDVADDVHHKVYRGRGKERVGDLEALCRQCHGDEHSDPLKAKEQPRRQAAINASMRAEIMRPPKYDYDSGP